MQLKDYLVITGIVLAAFVWSGSVAYFIHIGVERRVDQAVFQAEETWTARDCSEVKEDLTCD